MLKRQHQIFVEEMIQHGDAPKAYQAAYPDAKPDAARASCYRLLQNASIMSEIATARNKIAAMATQSAATELSAQEVRRYLTRAQKLQILHDIAIGTQRAEEVFVIEGEIRYLEVEPNHAARIKAIELASKIDGDFAPKKIAATDGEGNALPRTVSEDQFQQLLDAARQGAKNQ